jgi:ABC-type transport system involved in cytochrome c biogenesis permease subunit
VAVLAFTYYQAAASFYWGPRLGMAGLRLLGIGWPYLIAGLLAVSKANSRWQESAAYAVFLLLATAALVVYYALSPAQGLDVKHIATSSAIVAGVLLWLAGHLMSDSEEEISDA